MLIYFTYINIMKNIKKKTNNFKLYLYTHIYVYVHTVYVYKYRYTLSVEWKSYPVLLYRNIPKFAPETNSIIFQHALLNGYLLLDSRKGIRSLLDHYVEYVCIQMIITQRNLPR